MRNNSKLGRGAGAAALLALPPGAAAAQGLTIDPIGGPAPALGQVVSATSGTTIFHVDAASGAVTRLGGTGYRLASASSRPTVTLACGSDPQCATEDVVVTVSSSSPRTGRAGALGNFTIDPTNIDLKSGPSGTDPITFTIGPIGAGTTRSFAIGATFPILGDDSGADTGPVSSGFQVTARFSTAGTPAMASGTATATVFRPLTLSGTHELSFGTVARPRTGTGSVAIDAASGEATFSGDGVRGIGTAPHTATYSVTGEGGQSFSLLIPDSFAMDGASGSILVALTPTARGTQTLDGSIGAQGTMSFAIGGSFPISAETNLGAYSGTFTVTVQYQ